MKSPRRLTLTGVAALAVLAAGCTASAQGSGSGWATAGSAAAGSAAADGGMAKLVAAAKKEGRLNVIGLQPGRANYGTIIKDFAAKYGITVHSADPEASSQDEVTAVKSGHGSAQAPDVLDIDLPVALDNTSLFARYEVATWAGIPAAQKSAAGLWYQDYGGYMSIGYNAARFGAITSVRQLLGRKFRRAVALNGNPAQASTALDGVMMASLATGGTAASIAAGVRFFHRLKQAGNFVPGPATAATIRAGTTPVVINWDFANTASAVGRGPHWTVFVPANATLAGYNVQAISKNAPDPAAARLWEEFLYSQAAMGGQNLWLRGGARPVEMAAMTANGRLDQAAAARLPADNGTPVFLSAGQATEAASYLAANWAQAVK